MRFNVCSYLQAARHTINLTILLYLQVDLANIFNSEPGLGLVRKGIISIETISTAPHIQTTDAASESKVFSLNFPGRAYETDLHRSNRTLGLSVCLQ